MMIQKKIPQRMCIGCQNTFNKRDLLRLVRTPEGEYLVDETGKKSGRGAYICKNELCFQTAFKEKRLEKSFKSKIDQEVYEMLRSKVFKNA